MYGHEMQPNSRQVRRGNRAWGDWVWPETKTPQTPEAIAQGLWRALLQNQLELGVIQPDGACDKFGLWS